MITILSPAKNMRVASFKGAPLTEPVFLQKTRRLAAYLKGLNPWELESAMKLNPQLALTAFEYAQNFEKDVRDSVENTSGFPDWPCPALLAFHGLAYRYLDAASLTGEDLLYSQDHLRIVSALYGLLRPLDGIFPYRLEFQCKIKPEGKSLYAFWGDDLSRALSGQTVINLASAEYAKAVSPKRGEGPRVITCEFRVPRRGKLVTLPTEAKMARGRMARFILQNRLDSPEELTAFCWEGWTYCGELSRKDTLLFIRQ